MITQYVTNRLTRQREDGKLLREKAEELISTLHHHQHKLTIWRYEAVRRVEHDTLVLAEIPTSILLNLDLTYTLQRMYFPTLWDQLAAMEKALIPLVEWLEIQYEQQFPVTYNT